MRISPQEAIRLLNNAHIAAIPTETVYGLAASISSPNAIEGIFKLKGRPSNNPLIIHIDDDEKIHPFVKKYPSDFEALAKTFWPGPMTLILPIIEKNIPPIIRSGLLTAAFRIPCHPLALEVLKETGPLVMPSANLSGKPSGTCPAHIENDFGLDFPVLDGGTCQKGIESTILYFEKERWKIVRQGSIGVEEFRTCLDYTPAIDNGKKSQPLCPGQLYRHYAPKAKLILKKNFDGTEKGWVLGFHGRHYPSGVIPLILGSLENPETIAENLYSMLRQLDIKNIDQVYVDMNFPLKGILATVKERLERAAQG